MPRVPLNRFEPSARIKVGHWRFEAYVNSTDNADDYYFVTLNSKRLAWGPCNRSFMPWNMYPKLYTVLPISAIHHVEMTMQPEKGAKLLRVYLGPSGDDADFLEFEMGYARPWIRAWRSLGVVVEGAETFLTPRMFWSEYWGLFWVLSVGFAMLAVPFIPGDTLRNLLLVVLTAKLCGIALFVWMHAVKRADQ
jgi:hypothetical protein